MARSVRTDHTQVFRFRVTVVDDTGNPGIGGVLARQLFTPIAGNFASFSSVTIPATTLETEEFKEGNWEFKRRVVTGASLDTVTLQRGVTLLDSDFWCWAMAAVHGEISRKALIIQLLHRTQEPALPPGRAADRQRSSVLTGNLQVKGSDLIQVQLKPQIPVVAKEWIIHECIPIRVKPSSDLDASSNEVSLAELEVQGNWMEQTNLATLLPNSIGPNLTPF